MKKSFLIIVSLLLNVYIVQAQNNTTTNCPTLIIPINGAVDVPFEVIEPGPRFTFRWTNNYTDGEPLGNYLYLGTEPDNLSPHQNILVPAFADNISAGGLIEGTQYYYSIVPLNENGITEGCPVYSFSTESYSDCPELRLNFGDFCDDGDPLTTNDIVRDDCTCSGEGGLSFVNCPSIIQPVDGDPSTEFDITSTQEYITFAWTNDFDNGVALGHYLYLATDPNNLEPFQNALIPSPGSNVSLATLDQGTTYYYSIVPENENGITEGCPVYSFTTEILNDCPILEQDFGEPCDDGDPLTMDDVILTDCTCAGISSCYNDDKATLEAIYNEFEDTSNLTNWDFSPDAPLDNSWQGITMTADGCHVSILSISNFVGGTLSPEIGNLSQLFFLDLFATGIGGEFPSTIGNIQSLREIEVVNNLFTGSIPETLGNITELEFIDFNSNLFSGPLPESIADLPFLINVVLSNNNFTGCIPDAYQNFCSEYGELYDNDLLNNDFDEFCASGLGSCSDVDGDGIVNEMDNCQDIANENQADLDLDQIGDVCDNDIDGDGDINASDCNPTDDSIYVNAPCDDGDETTGDDIILIDCTCQGTLIDADGDGITDADDNCVNTDNADQADLDMDQIGDACDSDIDGDGVVNNEDCNPINEAIFLGATCDDGDPATIDDTIQSDCSCIGIIPFDCPIAMANFGDSCQDEDNFTIDDIIQSDCTCSGTPLNNFECTYATELMCGDVQTGSTQEATIDPNINVCDGTADLNTSPGVWYSFIGTGQDVQINTEGSTYDTQLAIYTGDCESIQCVTGNDDIDYPNNLQSLVEFNSEEGEVYLIYLAGYAALSGTYSLGINCVDIASNASCIGAEEITEGIYSNAQISGGFGAANNCFADGNNAIWYTYTPSLSGEVTISSSIDPDSPDTRLSVYTGSCNNLICEVQNDDISNQDFRSEVVFNAVAGMTYYIEWDDRWGNDFFDFEVTLSPWNCPSLEANIGDECNDGNANTSDDMVSADCICAGQLTCNARDKMSLEQVYNSFGGATANLNWDFSMPQNPITSDWTGITLDNNGCVKKIVLKEKDLNGFIDPAIGDLLDLTVINLSRNDNLTGSIPDEIGDLPKLTKLNLKRNNLNGILPADLANLSNTLNVFNVRNNMIGGCIPASYNAFCGTVDINLTNNANNDWGNNSFEDFCSSGIGACEEGMIQPIVENGEIQNDNKAIRSIGDTFSFTAYPNPNNGEVINLKLESSDQFSDNLNVSIYDLYGKIVLNQNIISLKKSTVISLNIQSELSPGIYFIEVGNSNSRKIEKLIIE